MRLRLVSAALVSLALASISCSEHSPTGPAAPGSLRFDLTAAALPSVRISEFHYDNSGTDAGEAIEVSMPAGTDLTGWQVVLYNGNGGASYNTKLLTTGTTPAVCGTRQVVVLSYPVDGIQNGSPDGIALVGPGSAVAEFLSYEGTFAAVGGPADGMTSTDIIAFESSAPIGQSLQRDGTNAWKLATSTFGACNDQDIVPATVAKVVISPDSATIFVGATQQFTAAALDSVDHTVAGVTFTWSTLDSAIATVSASGLVTGAAVGDAHIVAAAPNGKADTAVIHVQEAPPVITGPTFVSEIHYDNDGTDTDERIEIEGPAGLDVSGWSIVLYNGNGGASYNTIALTGVIPSLCDGRGVLVFPAVGIQNGDPDGLALVKPGSVVVEFLSYEGTFTAVGGPASGMTSVDIGARESGTSSATRSLQKAGTIWYGPASNTFGACNPAEPPPPTVSFSGRNFSDPALPVGFQDQLFASIVDASGNPVVTPITWSSDTPEIASIDQDGVVTSLAAGTAILRATGGTGATGTWTLPTRVGVASTTAIYAGNAEFGEPTDLDASDDYILRHPEYTTSFNKNRGTPNWVAYELDPTHYGPEDRCDCFTYDPDLPGSFTRYTTADYTGAGAFHGYGIDRGHLARSFDRTSSSLDNAFTFLFSNIVPQAADLNQGPWAIMENFLGDLARTQNKEVYIIAGVAGNIGTIKNQGKIVIPAQTWKVAVIMPHDSGLAQVHTYQDVQVIAVIMPNQPGVRNVDWHTYQTTVDAVEALSGYDLLALLADPVEIAVESNTAPPTAAVDGPYSGYLPKESISMSGAASTDPDNDVLTYSWSFGDGSSATGVNVTHAYSAGGTYSVRLIVTDPRGLADTATTTASVLTPAQGLADAKAIVASLLASGKIDASTANSLNVKLDVALASLQRGQVSTTLSQLRSLLNQLANLVATGVISDADAAPLRTLVNRVIASIS